MARKQAPEVRTTAGRIRGAWKAKGAIAVFRGVPFAAPPVGDLRWRAPQPVEPWTGVRNGTKDGQEKVNQTLLQIGREQNIKVVASQDIHFVDPSHKEAHEVKTCIGMGRVLRDNLLRLERSVRRIADGSDPSRNASVDGLPMLNVPEGTTTNPAAAASV